MGTNRQLPPDYLEAQHAAMRWLVKQGLTLNQIREARWGLVDEADKVISIPSSIIRFKYNTVTGVYFREVVEGKTLKIPLKGTDHEWFFLKSKLKCPWIFVREWPKTWRREESRESLYSLKEVEQICKDLELPPVNTNPLTNLPDFDTIDITKLNITKLETKENTEKILEANMVE